MTINLFIYWLHQYLTNINLADVNFSEEAFLSLAYNIFSMLFNLAEHVSPTAQVTLYVGTSCVDWPNRIYTLM